MARLAWQVLALTLLAILWGAVVRATGSGAGCGSHWPSCDGRVIPLSGSRELFIEFTHRLASGLALLGTVVLLWVAAKRFPARHRVVVAAKVALGLMVTEALIGAGLVRFEQVADNRSLSRAVWISAHLTNTFLLLATLTLVAWWARSAPSPPLNLDSRLRRMLVLGGGGIILVGITGAVAALGDTLFPPQNLAQGIGRDLSPAANLLERLRVLHPLVAIGVGAYLLRVAVQLREQVGAPARLLAAMVGVQFTLGLANLALAAPIWLQVLHLAVADAVWILFVITGAVAVARHPVPA